MDKRLEPQLKNSDEIKKVLKQVDVSFTLEDGRSVQTLLIYLPPDNVGNPLSQFFKVIKDGIMFNFVFSCTEIEKKLGVSNADSAKKLFEKAIRKISQHTAHGELGELILFTLLDVYFEAPKLLSKISTKTSRRMPVYGADAVHGQFYAGKFKLMLGESKLHQDFNSAATKATKSIKSAKETYQNEFDLLDSNMDFPNINADLEEHLLEILDPFSNTDLDEVLHSPCFIGFSDPDLIKVSGGDFENEYIKLACKHVGHYFNNVEHQGINVDKTSLILLPFESITDLVDQFVKYMDVKKMSDFVKKLSLKSMASQGYKHASNALFSSYIYKLVGQDAELDRSYVKKLVTVAQFLYKVNDSKFRKEGAAILSMLIEVCGNDFPEIIGIANKVFSSVGDFPNLRLIEKKYPELTFRYHFYSEAEMDFRKELNTVPELDFPLTDFQRVLWADLMSDEDIITVAPTSAGKTHIILSYLVRRIKESEGAFAAIIVPTRALISEVASKLYEISKEQDFDDDIEICTVPHDKGYGDKTFFVMTQERLFDVLQSGDISFNFLFIDEAHNIADESRGVLLHLTIEKLLEDSLPQVIVSMPSPSYQDSFSTIFNGIEFKKEITAFSPVAKIIIDVKPEGKNLIIKRQNSDNELKIKKGFTGVNFADIVFKLGQGNSNIIYRNQTHLCENFAKSIADMIVNFEVTEELEEAADYVEEFIHEDFTLADNLRKGVAFHYGPLPSSLRVMIENLVKENQIKFVACTSTLAEGVNLPAKNLFLKNPLRLIKNRPSERLEDVKINNITGRAGRMLEHFAGNIFVVEPDTWQIDDYFEDDKEEEEKIPTYFKSINDEFDSVVLALSGNYPHDAEEHYKFYTIANKLIKEISAGNLDKTIGAPELKLTPYRKQLLIDSVQKAYDSLQVAPFTLEANPTIGYIQQDKLFKFLNESHELKDWVLPHPKSANLYDVLLKVCEKLAMFGVYTPTGEYQLAYICVITKKWIQGDSLKSIITEQIKWLKDNTDDEKVNPNKAVRDVIKVINNDIRFRLSNALRCYQVLLTNVIALKGLQISSTKLHSYIEIGASNDRMITLINFGLSREAAKEIDENLPSNIDVESLSHLLGLLSSGVLSGIHPITKKELKSMIK